MGVLFEQRCDHAPQKIGSLPMIVSTCVGNAFSAQRDVLWTEPCVLLVARAIELWV